MQPITNFAEANKYLSHFYGSGHINYSLYRMKKLCAYLGNPQNNLHIIHVAGTSGKTSTAYYVSALLSSSGQKTGLTISPTIGEINERLQINSEPLSEEKFCSALSEFVEIAKGFDDTPSYFEFMMALAFWYFNKVKVDYAVVEVGIGGLKDASNVIERADKVCVITDIGLDHMEVLGKTLSAIATQKAGIIYRGNIVLTYKQEPQVMAAFKKSAIERGGHLKIVSDSLNKYEMPDYQFRNWNLAYAVFSYLIERDGLDGLDEPTLETTRRINIPGRMDIKKHGSKTIILDGAHNPQKMKTFIDSFSKLYPGVRPAVLLALKDGKAHENIASMLSSFASRIITTSFSVNQDLVVRSIDPKLLAEDFKDKVAVIPIDNQQLAFKELLESPENILVITGSIYLLGELKKNNSILN